MIDSLTQGIAGSSFGRFALFEQGLDNTIATDIGLATGCAATIEVKVDIAIVAILTIIDHTVATPWFGAVQSARVGNCIAVVAAVVASLRSLGDAVATCCFQPGVWG